MALIESQNNRTVVARLERQRIREAAFADLVEAPLNRAQRRAIAKSGRIVAVPSKRQIVKHAKKNNEEEGLRRQLAFFGPKAMGFEREGRYRISVKSHTRGMTGDERASLTRPLTAAEAHKYEKRLKRAKKRLKK